MEISPLQRILICLCVLSLSVVALAPQQAYASGPGPGIWGWITWIMQVAAGGEKVSFDIASWITSAFTAMVADTGHRLVTGCDHDTLMLCAQNKFEDGVCAPCNLGAGDTTYGFMPGGAFGYAALAVEGMSEINPPFSLAFYTKELKQNTLLGSKEAYAAPMDNEEAWLAGQFGRYYQDIFKEATFAFWKQMRNLAYLFFVLILIAMGFMVMLRYQVSPRVTVTVTSALPRIALGLILITFSYPIVSVAVDLIIPLTIAARNLVIHAWLDIVTSGTLLGGVLDNLGGAWNYSGIMGQVLASLATIFGLKVNLFSVLFCLVTLIALLITLFLAVWTFIKSFIMLIQAGIFGPLIIAWGTLPGQEDAITGWFKKIIANVLALPSIVLVTYAGLIILMINPAAKDNLILPFAFGADIAAQSITFIIGLSILWSAHKIPGKIDEAFSGGGNKR